MALEFGQRKWDAHSHARKISFLRTFTIFTYVNVGQQKRDGGNPPLETSQAYHPMFVRSQDGGHLRTFNARKKETLCINFYATVEICLRIFFYVRFTYLNIYASECSGNPT